jgi:predicted nuclease of predicted toxin-antitoxin system
MRLLVDECLHESLVGLAHAAGFEASHVNHLG